MKSDGGITPKGHKELEWYKIKVLDDDTFYVEGYKGGDMFAYSYTNDELDKLLSDLKSDLTKETGQQDQSSDEKEAGDAVSKIMDGGGK